MADVPPDVEALLAGLTDAEFAVLVAKTRAPDTTEQLRELAKTIVPAHATDAYMSVVDVSKFVGDDGQLDEARVRQSLGVLFGDQQPGSGHRESGQHGTPPPPRFPGDDGRDEARRRRGREFVAGGQEPAWDGRPVYHGPGAGGRQEAAKRHGNNRTGGAGV